MSSAPAARRPNARGVTFLELLASVAVMLILVTAALPTARTVHRRAKEKELKSALAKIRAAIDAYHLDWEQGFIESDSEAGWPESLEELTEEIEYTPPPPTGLPPTPPPGRGGAGPRRGGAEPPETETKVYLKRIPRDPFNADGSEWDTGGWRARSYEDEPDSTTWKGEGVYDVYSSSPLRALDGSLYEEW